MEHKSNTVRNVIVATIAFIILAIGCMYSHYTTHFLPKSTINGIDVSGMLYQDAENKILDELKTHIETFSIVNREGKTETVSLKNCGISVEMDFTKVKETNEKRIINVDFEDPLNNSLLSGDDYTIEYTYDFNEDLVKHALRISDTFNKDKMTYPQNAYIEKIPNEKAIFHEEVVGNAINKVDDIIDEIVKNLHNGVNECVLNKNDYLYPNITKDNPDLQNQYKAFEQLEKAQVTYQTRNIKKVVDYHTISSWITSNGYLDKEKLNEYVNNLAKELDTAYTERTYTLRDKTFTVTGPYGYKIDIEKEAETLYNELISGSNITREPIYSQIESESNNGLGDIFVEVDLTEQHVYLYKDGEIIKDSPCVTGKASDPDRITPPGIFPITYTQKNATLKGANYSSFVHYWMPFNKGIGLHDATWRSSFGGNIYKNSGSHGCVNLPLSFAKLVFSVVQKGTCVIVHD